MSPRATGVSPAQAGCARQAAATAASTSSRPERATRHRSEPSAGRSLSSQPPEAAGKDFPPTRFSIRSGITGGEDIPGRGQGYSGCVPALTEASLSDTERRALDVAVTGLHDELGDRLRSVWLYGSRARGEPPKPESDVDLLVVIDERDRETADRVHDAVWRAQEEVGLDRVYISTLVYDVARIANRREIRSFFIREVDRDKIVLYGEP